MWEDVQTETWQDSTHRHVLAFRSVLSIRPDAWTQCASAFDVVVGQARVVRRIMQFAHTTDPKDYD